MRKVISARKHEKIVAGHRRFEKGILFENEVADHYSSMGYKIKSRRRTRLGEIDIVATKSSFWRGSHALLIECKHKERISLSDFVRFVGKFLKFSRRAGEDQSGGVFAYRGELDPNIKTYYKTLDKSVRNAIFLERW